MPIKKRKGSPYYWYDFSVGGERFRGSCETGDREAAKRIEAKYRNDAILSRHLGAKPRITLDQALAKYFKEHGKDLASAGTSVKYNGEHLINHFGIALYIDELTDAMISDYQAKDTASNSTKNRRLALLSSVLNMAKDKWGVEESNVDLKKHKLKEPEARTRWITPEQEARLIACAPEPINHIIEFALLTGLRRDNIINLMWEEVDMQSRLVTVKIKSSIPGKKTHSVPLNNRALMILANQNPKQSGHVFVREYKTKDPRPIKRFGDAFKKALEEAGIKDFRFHDLRHTAASKMVQRGVPIEVVQQILGHSNISMTLKYAHHKKEALYDAVDELENEQVQSQYRHNPRIKLVGGKGGKRAKR